MISKLDSRQAVSNAALTRIGSSVRAQLDTILGLIDSTGAFLGTANTFTQANAFMGTFGVGTTTPMGSAQIHSQSGVQLTAAITNAGSKQGLLTITGVNGQASGEGGGILFGGFTEDNFFAAIKSLLSSGTGSTTGDLAFSTRNATGDTALTERMRITAAGNVGIGVTPSFKLDVSNGGGSVAVGRWASGSAGYLFASTSGNNLVGIAGDTGATFGWFMNTLSANSYVTAFTGNLERLRIDPNGLFSMNEAVIGGHALVVALPAGMTETTQRGVRSDAAANSAATAGIIGFYANPSSLSGSGTVSNVIGYHSVNFHTAGRTTVNQYGFYADRLSGGSGINAAFYSNQSALDTNSFAFYGADTAPSLLNGDLSVLGPVGVTLANGGAVAFGAISDIIYGSSATHLVRIKTNSIDRLWVDSTGAVGIGAAPETSTIFDVQSTTRGVAIPRMTQTQRDAIATPVTSLQIYNTDTNKINFYNGTSWVDIGSGSGGSGINYITNPDADGGTNGWTTYADAAGAAPVDGTGGSPNVTWTRTTSSPLRGTGSFVFTKDAANRQGQGVSTPITIDLADEGKVLTVSFDYDVDSGTYASGDLTVYLYDITNAKVIQPSNYQILSGVAGFPIRQTSQFQTASDSTSYRLIFHVATTSTSAYTLKIDNVVLGPQASLFGSIITDWISFTPTGTWTTNSTYTGRYRRVGDTAEVQIRVSLTGAPNSASLNFNLPPGLTVDTAKVVDLTGGQIFGAVNMVSAAAQYVGAVAASTTATAIRILNINSTLGIAAVVNQAAPATFANGDFVEASFAVPISGWSSGVQMSSESSTRVVSARYKASGAWTTNATNRASFDTKVWDTHGAVTPGSGSSNTTWLFTAPIQGYYHIMVDALVSNPSGTGQPLYVSTSGLGATPSHYISRDAEINRYQIGVTTIYLPAGGTFFISNNTASTTNYDFDTLADWITIDRIPDSSGNIAATETIAASYNNMSNSGAVSTTSGDTILWTNKDLDTHGGMSAGGIYTIPAPGVYKITTSVSGAESATTSSIAVRIYKNGSAIRDGESHAPATSGRVLNAVVDGLISCIAGDTINTNTVASFANLNYQSGSLRNYFHIHRVGS